MKRTKIIDVLNMALPQRGSEEEASICVKGWVRSKRGSKGIFFIALNDGSTIKNVQIVGDEANFPEETVDCGRRGQLPRGDRKAHHHRCLPLCRG